MTDPTNTIQMLDPTKLRAWPDNPREHSDDQIAAIAKSITAVGWMRPIVIDGKQTILAGHGAVLASLQFMPGEKVPCLVRKGLTTAQKRAYVIADNALADRSEWNKAALASEMAELIADDFDISVLGFSDRQLKIMTDGAVDANDVPNVGDDANRKRITCPKCAHEW